MKKLILVIIVLAVAGVIAMRFIALGKVETQPSIQDKFREDGVPVDVTLVRKTTIELWKDFTGTIVGVRQVDVFTNSPARVKQILKEQGDPVKKGEVIIRLDPNSGPMSATVYRSAVLQLDAAKRNFERITNLYEAGAVSKVDFENSRDAVELARASLQDTTRNLDLRAPIDGVVTKILTEVGNNAVSEQLLAVVAQTGKVKIKLDISQEDLKGMEVGQMARCTKKFNGEACATGEVTKIALSADPDSRLFAVEVTLDNQAGYLRPGVIETVKVLVSHKEQALVAKRQVSIFTADGMFAYRIDKDNTARLTAIEMGILSEGDMEIVSGVSEGDSLVVFGQNLLEDGMKILVRKTVSD